MVYGKVERGLVMARGERAIAVGWVGHGGRQSGRGTAAAQLNLKL